MAIDTDPTADLKDEIVRDISLGITLADICRRDHMPVRQTIYDWMAADDEFARRIASARDLGHDVIAEDVLSIVDNQMEDPASRRVRADMRLKLLAKWSPKKYGDRTQVSPTDTAGNDLPVAPIMFVGVEAKRETDD